MHLLHVLYYKFALGWKLKVLILIVYFLMNTLSIYKNHRLGLRHKLIICLKTVFFMVKWLVIGRGIYLFRIASIFIR